MSEKRECPGCGADLTGTHGKRKWCSERCRKQTVYSGTCQHCGTPTNGYGGFGSASDTCKRCFNERNKDRNERLAEMWEAGEPTWYIAEQLGISETNVRKWIDNDFRRNGNDRRRQLPSSNAHERWKQMIAWRRESKHNAEIAELLGTTTASVSMMFAAARHAGFKVPRMTRYGLRP